MSRELLRDCLEPLGVEVVEARDGLEALESVAASMPQLMLVDIQMPRMDGFELLREVRANPATARIPILAISAFAMAGDAERALARGFDTYITKPVSMSELRKLVRSLLPSRGLD
ncbi:MAG: response regulator [Bryobacterales bacterium]|nr:response regulator [Bryobacterales bacterium]